MTNHGDDCYFFYYSTCAKGDSCPFRHCEAAMGSEVVCSLWQESRCFRTVCKFRHMEIKKNRKQIACYWENQPAGCQKPHCAFHHEKPRFIDGVWVPANKGSALNDEEEPQEDPSPPAPTPLPTAANPQLRGVIKAETQENVPSPTHPPVVINPADDEDEDEDDQFSEEGEDSKTASDGSRLVSPRKMSMSSSSDESLNFGIRTLEEIRLRKALKASMRRSGHPIGQGSDSAQRNNGVSGEKENIRSFVRPSLYLAKDDTVIFGEETGRRNVAERLGKRIVEKDVRDGGDMPLKRRLAERLGRKVDEEDTDPAPQIALKPVRDRLGLPAEPTVVTESAFIKAETNSEAKASEEIRIKTLEEIRQEKAAKSQGRKDNTRVAAPDTTSPTTRASKRVITVKPASNSQKKTFSEVLHARKKLEEEQHQGQSLRKARQPAKEAPDNSQASTDTAMPSRVTPPRGGVRVKTLDEIRKEKAARMQARVKEAANGKSPVSGPEVGEEKEVAKKPRIMRINKPASPATASTTAQKTAEVTEKPAEPTANVVPEPSPANGRSDLANKSLKVKTFEEIMREKRLRKQQLQEEQASSTSQSNVSAKAKPAEKAAPGSTLVREKSVTPIRVKVTPPNLSSPSSPTLTLEAPTLTIEAPTLTLEAPTQAPKAPIRQRITLKPKAASPVPSVATSPQQGSPLRQAEADSPSLSPRSSTAAPGKRKRGPMAASASKQAKGASSPGPSAEEPPVEKTQDGAQRKSPGQVAEAKVRPKLNVKPSVMKPAAQVKPGQKRRAAESPRSAVAAVKPLNSASMAQDEQLQEPTCKRRGVSSPSSSTDAQMSPLVPRSPPTLLGHGPGSSPLREELQTVPVIEHSTAVATPAVTTTSDMAARESCVVPQSPTAVKTPTQPRPRRTSVVTSSHPTTASTSTMDDFDELMNEFTDDRLEDEMELDPGKGEDDLLLELSEMIDS